MPKRKKTESKPSAIDAGSKQMILKVDSAQHAWIKTIAEQTGTPQPKIVAFILAQASKTAPIEYITQIKKLRAKDDLQRLESEARKIESERKRLNDLLAD